MSAIVDFFKAVAGICQTTPLRPELWKVEGNRARVRVSRVPELQVPWGAVYLKGEGLSTPLLIIKKPDGGYLCAENRCTHMGRKLDPVPGKEILRCCSVSHSTFDLEGNNLGGPAGKPIVLLPVKEENGELTVEL